jgi:hypothetical protein
MTFVAMSEDELRIESVNPPGDLLEPVHVHPRQESGAEVLSGCLVFEVDGSNRRLSAGETIAIPAGVPHRFWAEGEEAARSVQFFRPALDIAAFFETLFGLAQRGELDSKGMPSPLQLAVMVPEFSDEIRTVRPPWPITRVATTLVRPLARARGKQARLGATSQGSGP